MNALTMDAHAAVAAASSSIETMSTADLCHALTGLCQAERRTEWLLCRHLAELADRFERSDPALGAYTDIYQLARLRYGIGVRRTRERVRIGRAVRRVPQLERRFVDESLSYSQVRELTRVVTPETETHWLQEADVLSLRVLERRVAEVGARDGADKAGKPKEMNEARDPARLRWTSPANVELGVELPAAAWALLERAMEGARRASDCSLSDAEALEAVARDALARQAEDHDRSDVRSMVVLLRDRMRCRSPGCHRRRYVDVHHIHAREHGGEHSRANCVTLCTSCHDRVHDGRLQISGDAERDLVFRDGSGKPLEGAKPATPRGHAGGGFALSASATRILAVMGPRGVWITDVLQERSALAIPQLSASLIELELAGRVRRTASGAGYEVLS